MEKETINKIATMDDDMFVGMLEDGTQKTFYNLLSFEDNGIHYLTYTDNETNESGELNVYAAIVNKKDDYFELLPIDDDKKWQTIKKTLDLLQEK